jgi:hypothetical protein
MRYTFYRGLAQVSNWVRLKFAAMNLKKLARWKTRKRFAPSSSATSYILSLINFVWCLCSLFLLFYGMWGGAPHWHLVGGGGSRCPDKCDAGFLLKEKNFPFPISPHKKATGQRP